MPKIMAMKKDMEYVTYQIELIKNDMMNTCKFAEVETMI
jgi:hypothetical protein